MKKKSIAMWIVYLVLAIFIIILGTILVKNVFKIGIEGGKGLKKTIENLTNQTKKWKI